MAAGGPTREDPGDAVTLDDLDRELRALQVLTGEFLRTRDPDRLAELTALAQEQARTVQELSERLGDAHLRAHGVEPGTPQALADDALRGRLEVCLTPRQVERVKALTGEALEAVLLPDPTGVLARTMAPTPPSQVELWAVRDVVARQRARDAEADADRVRAGAERRIAWFADAGGGGGGGGGGEGDRGDRQGGGGVVEEAGA